MVSECFPAYLDRIVLWDSGTKHGKPLGEQLLKPDVEKPKSKLRKKVEIENKNWSLGERKRNYSLSEVFTVLDYIIEYNVKS